ncbi:hypothetical protein K2173_019653 [Erythroxylum novogranatense]|uniref:Uncharacterized protein n=1 Tax=Erythroxylum novogranatense TaxID=1862640 RepID=A0AAV8UFV2_9ROSI|nr:hypothetical protein K2173_019653 [Erythroxylum novogranatense]
MDEPQDFTNYSSLLGDSSVFAATHEDCPSSTSYPHLVLDYDYPFQEGFFDYFVSQPYQNVEVYSVERIQETEQPLFTNSTSYGNEYDCCFDFSGCCADNPLSYDDNADYISDLENAEDWFRSETLDNSVNLYEHTQNQLSWDESPWSNYPSWLDFVKEEGGTSYCKQEPLYGSTYSIDDLGICEGIFGYWPCMTQKHPEALVL